MTKKCSVVSPSYLKALSTLQSSIIVGPKKTLMASTPQGIIQVSYNDHAKLTGLGEQKVMNT
jgi:hypothetical protein